MQSRIRQFPQNPLNRFPPGRLRNDAWARLQWIDVPSIGWRGITKLFCGSLHRDSSRVSIHFDRERRARSGSGMRHAQHVTVPSIDRQNPSRHRRDLATIDLHSGRSLVNDVDDPRVMRPTPVCVVRSCWVDHAFVVAAHAKVFRERSAE